MTLLEVILASVILVVSLAALAHQGIVAVNASLRTEETAIASMVARDVMDGLLSATLPPSLQDQSVEERPGYVWRSEIRPSEMPELLMVQVQVRKWNDRPGTSLLTLSQLVRSSSFPPRGATSMGSPIASMKDRN